MEGRIYNFIVTFIVAIIGFVITCSILDLIGLESLIAGEYSFHITCLMLASAYWAFR